MKYRIRFNDANTVFHVSDEEGVELSTHNPLPDFDGWDHRIAARCYIEQIPSDASYIQIDEDGEYTISELQRIALGGK